MSKCRLSVVAGLNYLQRAHPLEDQQQAGACNHRRLRRVVRDGASTGRCAPVRARGWRIHGPSSKTRACALRGRMLTAGWTQVPSRPCSMLRRPVDVGQAQCPSWCHDSDGRSKPQAPRDRPVIIRAYPSQPIRVRSISYPGPGGVGGQVDGFILVGMRMGPAHGACGPAACLYRAAARTAGKPLPVASSCWPVDPRIAARPADSRSLSHACLRPPPQPASHPRQAATPEPAHLPWRRRRSRHRPA
jgi:hypothetical protein